MEVLRQTGYHTRRVSLGPGGAQANELSTGGSISADGRYVAFVSDASNLVAGDTNDTGGPFGGRDVFVRDRTLGITRRVSVRTGGAQAEESGLIGAVISADGRWVAFSSDATNLVGDDANGDVPDIYLHRLATQTTSW
jgi:Tol biopolymer transport system component